MRTLADTAPFSWRAGCGCPGLDAKDCPLVTVTSTSQQPTIYALNWESP